MLKSVIHLSHPHILPILNMDKAMPSINMLYERGRAGGRAEANVKRNSKLSSFFTD